MPWPLNKNYVPSQANDMLLLYSTVPTLLLSRHWTVPQGIQGRLPHLGFLMSTPIISGNQP